MAHGVEERVHAAFFDFADVGHEFAEAAFGEAALFEPDEVFLREVDDGDAVGWVFFLSEHAERHVGAMDFREEVAEVLAVDFGEIHEGEVGLAGRRRLARFVR